MGRNKKSPDESVSGTISFRTTPSIIQRYEQAISETGVSKSDVLRILVRDASDADIAAAIQCAQIEHIQALQSSSTSELKQKRIAAQKMIAWVDAQLKERSESVLTIPTSTG
jgi:antitoxin component of RelBE/YafQ-DinJ toxin-antitoxin module